MGSDQTKFHNLSLADLRTEQTELLKRLADETAKFEAAVASTRQRFAEVAEEVRARCADALHRARTEKPEGVVRVEIEGVQLESDRSKRVTFDQAIMAAKVGEMIRGGAKLEDWGIKTEYTIPESKWKAYPPTMREFFASARVLKLGEPTLVFAESAKGRAA